MAALHVFAFTFLCVTLLGSTIGVTDEEFQSLDPTVAKILEQFKEEIGELKGHNQEMEKMVKTQDQEIRRLSDIVSRHQAALNMDNRKCKPEVLETDLMQNNTIEERVALLEIQVTVIEDDVTDLEVNLMELDESVDFLFDEQIIQDERILNVEETSDQVVVELAEINANVEDIETTTLALDFRVTALEENGGDDGNSSVTELEVRVETLEGTAADHETRLTTAETDVEALETTTCDQEVRLSAAEENIQGLQLTDVNHDARILALEENGGSGSQNDTIAFHSVLTSYSSISPGSRVIFNEVLLNEGDCYDSTTGVFTVPPGGDGVYYFSLYLLVQDGEFGIFDMMLNDYVICSTFPDHSLNGDSDFAPGSCSTVVSVLAGDEVQVVYDDGDTTPLFATTSNLYNGFNGFRI